MTVRDVWQTNPMFRFVMTLIAGVGVSAVVGLWVMYGQVRANTEILQEVRSDIQGIERDYGERLRYLERRRGLSPGDP